MWMLGIVLYELMTLEKPFEEKSLHVNNTIIIRILFNYLIECAQ